MQRKAQDRPDVLMARDADEPLAKARKKSIEAALLLAMAQIELRVAVGELD